MLNKVLQVLRVDLHHFASTSVLASIRWQETHFRVFCYDFIHFDLSIGMTSTETRSPFFILLPPF